MPWEMHAFDSDNSGSEDERYNDYAGDTIDYWFIKRLLRD
jgi:hypothetical protein